MAGPIDPRLLRRARATRSYLVAGVAVGGATAILTIGQAWLLSRSVADIFATGSLATLSWAVVGLIVVFCLKAILGWANEWLAQRTAARVKSQLRRDIVTARLARPYDDTGSGSLVTLVTQGLDGLDGYFSKYLPQLLLAVTVPLIIGVAVLGSDLTSALILAITLPLIPFFMALVGWTTETLTRRRWAVQTRLANHFADLIMGLPTLQVFGRARAQAAGLKESEDRHRGETMRTLRVSFLSALVLELLATLSVAVIAVTIGFRVVFGELDLTTALFILILAPEAYLPLRQVGTHYHDAADGLAAVDQAFALIDAPASEPADEIVADDPSAALEVHQVGHSYPGETTMALAPVSFSVRAGEIVAITGPSGAGKTTLLNAVMGFLSPTSGSIGGGGRSPRDSEGWRERIAWVAQNPGLLRGTVADNVRLGFPAASDLAVVEAMSAAGASGLSPDQPVGEDGEGVSAGERRRIAVARALLRVTLGRARLLVLDEPTAGLDADTEASLLDTLRQTGVAVLVVSHRPAVWSAADRVISISGAEDTLRPGPVPLDPPRQVITVAQMAGSVTRPGEVAAPRAGKDLLRQVFAMVPDARRRLLASILLAFAATGASVALMGVSAWLLSRAAELPPVLYLQAAAVAVRFFGISRGAFRYLERLVGHDVALRMQSALRLHSYRRLAETTLLGGSLNGRRRGDLLTRVIADVEAVQDLVVRVWIPFVSSAAVIVVTSSVLAWFSPGSAAVLLLTSIAASLLVPWLVRRASARADAESLPLRGRLADATRELSRTAADLVAYGAEAGRVESFARIDEDLRVASARSAWVRGVGTAAQILTAGTAVIAALVIGGHQVAEGSLAPVMLAVLVLTPLALHEALSNLLLAAQVQTRAAAALQRVAEVTEAEPVGAGDLVATTGETSSAGLRADGLAVGWPGADVLVSGIHLDISAGEKVALVGPSGIGKTTLAATLLGLIPPRAGTVGLSGRIGYLAQDAHLFATTVAENVRIGRRDADEDQILTALGRAGLDLDPGRLVGESGATLSGGEARRVALARLLVGDYRVLVLDEPSEHLDAATAAALIDDIWAGSAEQALLIVSHDPAVINRCDRVLELRRA